LSNHLGAKANTATAANVYANVNKPHREFPWELYLIRTESKNIFPVGEEEWYFAPKFWDKGRFTGIWCFVKTGSKFFEERVSDAPKQRRQDDPNASLKLHVLKKTHFYLISDKHHSKRINAATGVTYGRLKISLH
jgi:hypothetical protein